MACQKHLFSLEESTHYLNGAYMSPLLKRVEAAGIAGIQRKRDPSRIQASDFFEESDRVRQAFARLINVPDPKRIAIIPSVSYGLANVAQNIKVHPGQNIVLLHEQFPSNVYPWRKIAPQPDTIRTVKPPDSGPRGQGWNEYILEAIDQNTAVVALAPVHWADGTRFDLERIGQRARKVGAAFIVDGTQAVGAMPFDLQQIQPDALVCAGYKWLLCPYSTGIAYYGPRFDQGTPIEQSWMLRKHSEDFGGLVNYQDAYQPGAIRYDVGERSNFALMPMMLAALEQLWDWDVEAIQPYCKALLEPFFERLEPLGYGVEDQAWRGSHLFGLRMPPQVKIDSLMQRLKSEHVFVSVRGDAIRISVHLYNNEADLVALLRVLEAVV